MNGRRPVFILRENPTIERAFDHVNYIVSTAGEDCAAVGPNYLYSANQVLVPLLRKFDPSAQG